MDFQARRFGVTGVLSAYDPRRWKTAGPFDIILSVSLFSHLPRRLFAKWLEKILSICAEDGTFIFSTHPAGDEKGSDFRYAHRSESRRLRASRYGMSRVAFRFVENALREAGGGREIAAYLPRALNGHQDIYVVRSSGAETGDIAVRRLPVGCVDFAVPRRGGTEIAGWAYDAEFERPVEAVTLYVNGEPMGDARLNIRRDDVARHFGDPHALGTGFSLECPGTINPGDIVCADIRGRAASGLLFYRSYAGEEARPALARRVAGLFRRFIGTCRGRRLSPPGGCSGGHRGPPLRVNGVTP